MRIFIKIFFHVAEKIRAFSRATIFLFGIALLISINSFSQISTKNISYTVEGVVIDSITGKPLAAASIALHNIKNGLALETVLSDEHGSFRVSIPPNQAYDLIVTNIGYATKKLLLPASHEAGVILNNLQLSPQLNILKEVKVKTWKNFVSYEADKLVYNVEDDPESNYLSTFDILRKVPMLSINGEDNIELNGSNSYEVLVNNRPSSLFVNNVSDVFKSLPANSVKSIEIISNPSAKYDAEGVSGIINIVTYNKNITGTMGTMRAAYNSPGGPGIGGSVMLKTGKFGFSGLGNYSQNESPLSTTYYKRVDKVNNTSMYQAGESKSNNRNLNFGGEMNWELSSLDLFNIHYNQSRHQGNSSFGQQAELTGNTGLQLQSYRNENNNRYTSPGYDMGMDYQHAFKKNKDQLLTVSFRELRNRNYYTAENLITEKINSSLPDRRSANNNSFTERTAQIDYVQPIKKHSFELGIKTISRTNNSTYSVQGVDTATGLYILDQSLSNNYDNRQNIYAGYGSLTLKAGKWTFRPGARVEQTIVAAQFHSTGTTASQSYSNIIPNISIFKSFGTSNLSLSYSQRLERPGLYYLNPYIDNRDPYNIHYGNPDLQSTITHVATLMFNTSVKGTSFNINFNHDYTGNSILSYTTIGTDTVARTTFGNIGNEQIDGLSLSSNFTLFKKLNFNINTFGTYRKYNSVINNRWQNNEGFSYQLSGYGSFSFFKTWRTSFNAGYNSSSISFQSKAASYFTHSVSLNKSFLKDRKAGLSISVNSLFQPYRGNSTEIEQEQFYILRQYKALARRFTFTFNYRFGKLNGGIRPKKAGIENDDLKSK